jgi:hypothetical protein
MHVIWEIILRFFLSGKLRGRRLRRGADSDSQARAFAFERR